MTNREDLLNSGVAIETILRSAPPRPAPSAEDTASARSALRDEWLAMYARRRTRRRLLSLAAAASIIGAVAAGLMVLRVPSALPEPVATLERSVGPIYLLDEKSILHEMTGPGELSSGQALITGSDAAVALGWLGGGSLRIDEDSRVEFLSAGEIYLHDGRIYFDSQPSALLAPGTAAATATFAVRTGEGLVRHMGTQYMAGVSASGVTVSVREGQVEFVGNTVDATATAGQQVRLRGNAHPAYTNISAHGDLWRWAERIAPGVNVDERSAFDFIGWAARESGLDVRFASDTAKMLARATRMTGGSGNLEPREALQVLLKTTTLEATIEDGAILISER